MITLVAKLQAAAGKESELQAALEEMVGKVRQHEQGKAVTYSLHVSASDPTLFLFYEQYSDEAALAAHGQTAHMKEMGGKLAGLLGGRPEIERYSEITRL